MPRVSRYRVTLVTGAITTIVGLFPAVAMQLLDFVALYGMVLMPMGAVVFVDFWLSRRFGFQPNYAEHSGTDFNWAAGLTWFATLAGCVLLGPQGRRSSSISSAFPAGSWRRSFTLTLSRLLQRACGRPHSRRSATPVITAARLVSWLALGANDRSAGPVLLWTG